MRPEIAPHWIDEQIDLFAEAQNRYKQYAETLENILKAICRTLAPLAIIQVRVKTLSSFAEKAVRKFPKYTEPARQFTDLCGCRVITQTQGEADRIAQFIRESFDIDVANSENKRDLLGVSSFGYLAMHYIVQFPSQEEILGIPLPQEVIKQGLKAEIQVKTMLQHAWATVVHDTLYKNRFVAPREWHREMNRLAATLEETDAAFSRFMGRLDVYAMTHGGYMPAKQREVEIKTLELILEKERNDAMKPCHALRIAGILKASEDWTAVVNTLTPFSEGKDPVILRELGNALCRASLKDKRHSFAKGLEFLGEAAQSNPKDAETHAALAWALIQNGNSDLLKANKHLAQAYELNPSNPYYLSAYLEMELLAHGVIDLIAPMRPTVQKAIETCIAHIEARIEIPCAFFTAGRLSLLLNMTQQSVLQYMNGLKICLSERNLAQKEILEAELAFLHKLVERIPRIKELLPAVACALRLLTIAVFVKAQDIYNTERCSSSADSVSDKTLSTLEAAKRELLALMTKDVEYSVPVLILAGSCAMAEKEVIDSYSASLTDALMYFHGVIISGGTLSGVAKLAADIAEAKKTTYGGSSITTLAYLPSTLPNSVQRDTRYNKLIQTEADDFGFLEPLQMWTDLLAHGVNPASVKLIGIGGGVISAFEYRLALLLGAQVGVMEMSGRAAEILLDDPEWSTTPSLLTLYNDRMTIRCFLADRAKLVDQEAIESIARESHDDYRAKRLSELLEKPEVYEALYSIQPNIKPWELLEEGLQDSNRGQAEFMVENLRWAGFAVELGDHAVPLHFTEDEIEMMAETEHGRWNVERSRNGWRYGEQKNVEAKISPYLVPWEELPDNIKDYDRVAVREYPQRLQKIGYLIVRTGNTCCDRQ